MNTEQVFYSTTFGVLKFSALRGYILRFLTHDPSSRYTIVIGTDSQPGNGKGVDFITAIVLHRVGQGGIYFWKRTREARRMHLRSRIYHEALLSLSFAQDFLTLFSHDGIAKYDIEIHVDIGTKGDTRDMISEVVGMIRGSGFSVKTKPDSYAASKVADRHT